ncbi:hypothetical protein WH47_03768, partial [Habropoda laboriosa]
NGRAASEGQRRCAGSLSVILRPADRPVSHRLKRTVEVLIRVSGREPRSLITGANLIWPGWPVPRSFVRSPPPTIAITHLASLLTGCDFKRLIDVYPIVADRSNESGSSAFLAALSLSLPPSFQFLFPSLPLCSQSTTSPRVLVVAANSCGEWTSL